MTFSTLRRCLFAATYCFLVVFGALILLIFADLTTAQNKQKKSIASKATTIQTNDFLKVREKLSGKDFVVAKTAPKVDVAFFSGLDKSKEKTLWSSWGDGCFASNGKYYTSIGDHLGTDARSYVYEYDPMTKVLRRVVDVLQTIMHMLGLYGHGKIHSGIHEAADGWLYFSTYWGKHREIEAAFKKGYKGSLLMRYNPKTGKAENLGPIVPYQGLPTSTFDSKRNLLYFYAVYKDNVAVYDLKARKVKFLGGEDRIAGDRAFLVGNDGKVYFSTEKGTLGYYDPQTNKLGSTTAKLPSSTNSKKGDTLRAGVRATKNGILYGMTAAGRMFAFNPKTETIKDLGPNFLQGDYTAVMELSPDEKYLYFAPGAHGSGNRTGAPVVQYNITTGQRKVLAFLRDPLRQRFNYNIGGTYNLDIDPSGQQLFFTFNGAPVGGRRPLTFGQPSVVVVHIPESER